MLRLKSGATGEHFTTMVATARLKVTFQYYLPREWFVFSPFQEARGVWDVVGEYVLGEEH